MYCRKIASRPASLEITLVIRSYYPGGGRYHALVQSRLGSEGHIGSKQSKIYLLGRFVLFIEVQFSSSQSFNEIKGVGSPLEMPFLSPVC